MPTINDIAHRLGISASTVSRALRGSHEISEEVRARVEQTAREINYTPNLMARSLVRASSESIGCLILQFANPFFIPLIQAIEDVFDENGYAVLISQSHRRLDVEKRVLERFAMAKVDGAIVTPLLKEMDHLQRFRKLGIPMVIAARVASGFDCISVDNRMGGKLIGEHLVKSGHRHIGAAISGEPFNEPERSRILGLLDFTNEADAECRQEDILSAGSNDVQGGERAAAQWMSLPVRLRPTAMFCSNDRMAMGFIHSLTQAGLRVPDDVSVAGFDDIPFAAYLEVPLTTIAIPKYEIGRLAAEKILRRLAGEKQTRKPEPMLLQPELVVRKSTGGV